MTTQIYRDWTKSRRSDGSGNCVECAISLDGTMVALRNSRFPDGPILEFDRAMIGDFISDIKSGELDSLLAVSTGTSAGTS